MTKPEIKQRPEGAALEGAMKRRRLSARQLAKAVGMSDARVRQILNGYASVGAGQKTEVVGPAATIARLAKALGVTQAELIVLGREDAARELSKLYSADRFDEANRWLHDGDDIEARYAYVLREIARTANHLASLEEERASLAPRVAKARRRAAPPEPRDFALAAADDEVPLETEQDQTEEST